MVKLATAIYMRVSTETQEDEGVSLDAQREQLHAYCKFKGLTNIKEYLDVGSARTTNRINFKRMMTDFRNKRISNVVVWKLDRLTRSIVDLNTLITEFNKLDCALHSSVESIDSKTATGRMIINLIGTFAQWESESISERVKFAMDYNATQGVWQGVTPFGYYIGEDKRLKIKEDEKDILLEAFDMIESGYSINYVENFIPKKYNLKWGGSFLLRKIKSAHIVGDVERNGVITHDTHEPIISKTRQRRFLQRIQSNQSPRSTQKRDDLFRRKIKCFRCDKIMSFAVNTQNNKEYFGYRCKYCKKHDNVPVYVSETRLLNVLPKYLESIKIDKTDVISDDKESVLLQKKINDIENKKDRLQRAWIDNLMSDDDLRVYQKELDEELEVINDKLIDIGEPIIKAEFEEAIKTLKDSFNLMNRDDKRTFIQKFVKHIEFKRELIKDTRSKYKYSIIDVSFY